MPQMVGIGTSDVNLDKYRHTFCSLLGKDEESWGLSYTGNFINTSQKLPDGVILFHSHISLMCVCICVCVGLLHHKGDKISFSSRFGQGSILGVHLDTWHGTLTFFKNRKCIGQYQSIQPRCVFVFRCQDFCL